MAIRSRFNHRLNFFLGDFDRAILAHAVAQDPALNYSDVVRDALRYYAWHHPGFDPEGFEDFIPEYRGTVTAPPATPYEKKNVNRKYKRRRKPPPTAEEKLARALRMYDDEVEIYRRRDLTPALPDAAGPIDSDFSPLEEVGDLLSVESDFHTEGDSFNDAAIHAPTDTFVGGTSGFSSDAFSPERK
jgi:hypothetical protein